MAGSAPAIVDELRRRGVTRGILVKMARAGQILELRCEMPSCYCPHGREHFDKKTQPMGKWAPNPDHYPRLKRDGGRLTPDNVRVAHSWCNLMDYGWRSRVRTMLRRDLSLEEIADRLNAKAVSAPHGSGSWNADLVRRAYVS